MTRFNGGICRPDSRRDRRFEHPRLARAAGTRAVRSWTLTMSVLGFALLGATTAGGQTSATTHAQATPPRPSSVVSAAASRVRAGHSATPSLGDQDLALGAGYDTPRGSSPVRTLQRHLALAGFLPGPLDGRYGPLTRQAVVGFQASHGLQVDGIVGPETWAALSSSRLSLYPGAGNQPGGSELVRALQRRLALAGYAPGPIDGRYGQLTEQAVRHFQAAHGLPADGVAGPSVLRLTTTTARPVHRLSHRVSAEGVSRRRQAQRAATRVTTNVTRSTHHSSARSVSLLLILSTTGLAVMLVAVWYVRRRSSPAPPARVDATGSRAAELHSNIALPPAADAAATTSNSSEGRDGSVTATAAPNGNDRLGDGHAATAMPNGGNHPGADRHAAVGDDDPARPESAAAEGMVGRVDQNDDVDAAFTRGLTLEDQGDVDGAIAAYGRADEGGHAAAASNLGVLLEERGASVAAEAAYRRANERGDATGAFNHGVLLEERGALAEAEAAYRRSDERGHAAAASNLGVLLEQRGASDAAEAAYRRSDQRGEATGAFNLGVLLEERGDLAEAEEAYARAHNRGNDEVLNVAHAALLKLRARAQEPSVTSVVPGHHDD